MNFQVLRNIETFFQRMRVYAALFALLCLLVTVITVWLSYRFASAQREKIYVLDQGRSLMLALSQDQQAHRPVEARDHMRRFHELFFNLSPDPEAIRMNVDRALSLCDESAYHYYQDLLEGGYFKRIISGNVLQRLEVDSVVGHFDTHPYAVQFYGRLLLQRASQIVERSLVTSALLFNSVRSDANPHGFLMRSFTVLDNRDLRVIKREL